MWEAQAVIKRPFPLSLFYYCSLSSLKSIVLFFLSSPHGTWQYRSTVVGRRWSWPSTCFAPFVPYVIAVRYGCYYISRAVLRVQIQGRKVQKEERMVLVTESFR